MRGLLVTILAAVIMVSFAPKEKTWVAIGDSITYLNDHPDETGDRVKKGYMTMVAEKIPGLQFINQGHNGWTSAGIAEKIESLGLIRADVYTVFLGTNDWWQGRPVGTMEDYKNKTGNNTLFGSYAIIISKLRSLNKDAKIILLTPLQRVDFVYIHDAKNNAWGSYKNRNGQSLEEFVNAIKAIAAYEHLAIVDLFHNSGITLKNLVKFKRLKDPKTGKYKNYPYPLFVGIPFNPETDEYPYPLEAIDMTYDGLHPSDKGNAVIAKMLVKAIKK